MELLVGVIGAQLGKAAVGAIAQVFYKNILNLFIYNNLMIFIKIITTITHQIVYLYY